MSTRISSGEAARRRAREIEASIARDLHLARVASGLSQKDVAEAAGMSPSQLGRIERGELHDLTIDQVSRAAAAVGLRLVVRTYPDGDPVRDAAHLALLERFRGRLGPGIGFRTEVPLPIAGDRRAWDAVAGAGGRRGGCEAETALRDVQAVKRRLALKFRDGDVDVPILIVSDTASNRTALAAHRHELRDLLPLDGRDVLRALARGSIPPAGGIVVL